MLIQTEHARILRDLLEHESSHGEGASCAVANVQRQTVTELERQGLVSLDGPLRHRLTYHGRQLAMALDAVVNAGACPSPEDWAAGWRWLGSEVLTLLEDARLAGQVGPFGREALQARGLMHRVHDRERKRETEVLSEAGETALSVFHAVRPKLAVDAALADRIRALPSGPMEAMQLRLDADEKRELEAMRVLAYSVPDSDIVILTGLGRLLQETLQRAGFGREGLVLDVPMLEQLAAQADGATIPESALVTLQSLGYLNAQGEPTEGGEWALRLYRRWSDPAGTEVWSFHLEEDGAVVLFTLRHLWEAHAGNPEIFPDAPTLRREMIERQKARYKALIERWPNLEDMPRRYRKIAVDYQRARDLDAWYERNFSLVSDLYLLEAFDLVRTESLNDREVYRLTDHAERVLEALGDEPASVPGLGVKAINHADLEFAAPNRQWVEIGRAAGLLGPFGATQKGRLFGELAHRIRRLPHITILEIDILHAVGGGSSVTAVEAALQGRMVPEKLHWALQTLEARHLLQLLPDGNVVLTRAGRLMREALSGVQPGLANPIHPVLYRTVQALAEVGTLYEAERKIRVLPRQMEAARTRAGVTPEAFHQALHIARLAGLVGKSSVTAEGLRFLDAVAAMNPPG